MREILFRGKRQDNNEWIEGCLIRVYERVCRGVYQPREYAIQSAEEWIAPRYVVAETVGQYTGLTDKNGKRIFEGDIVRGKDCIGGRREGSVFYENYNAMYMIKPNTKSEYREVNCFTSLTPAEAYLEIIGNIHDNPELLEVKE